MKEEKNILFTSIFGNIFKVIIEILGTSILLYFIFKINIFDFFKYLNSIFNFYLSYLIIIFLFILIVGKIILDYIKLSIMLHLEKNFKSKFDSYTLDEQNWNTFNIFSPLGYIFQSFLERRKFISELFLGNNLKLDIFLIKKINLYRNILYFFYGVCILGLIIYGVMEI